MKVTPRFMIRAALVLTAGGVIGAFGACKDSNGPAPQSPPPPPPPLTAPAAPTVSATDTNKISLAWTYADQTVTAFRLDRCSGAGCTNFAQVGTNLAGTARAFTDSGLVNHTQYSYRLRAQRGADTSAWSPTMNATTGTTVSGGSAITMIGAGEITTCSSVGTSQTAALVQDQVTADPKTIVFTAGNNVAAPAGAGNYSTCFDPTWGKFKSNMHAALGDMDFKSTSSNAPYQYFGTAIGSPKGYYSFDAGSWHVIVLNTTAEGAGKCDWSRDPVSRTNCTSTAAPQLDWLASDLAANTKPCLMAISWERRLYTAGPPNVGALGRNSDLNAAAEMLYAAGLDILVSAKDQQYERFPKLGVDGAADPKGFAQFIVGTGGRSLGAMHTPAAGNPVAAQYGNTGGPDAGYGVVKFTLNDNSYGWEFLSTAAGGFSDKSTTPVACN